MKVVLTEAVGRDLDHILGYVSVHYPQVSRALEARLHAVFAHIGRWPLSSPVVLERKQVRMRPLGRYPYNIYYRPKTHIVEILRIVHSSMDDIAI